MKTNVFYHGDCITILSHDIESGSIDLIYLDPPFFTGKVQKGTVKANAWMPEAMEVSYEDSKAFWKEQGYATHAPAWLKEIGTRRPDFASYLYYMRLRLQQCHRVLKPTGSIYLHCDEKASHYLKMIMDEIFGWDNFRNELVWRRMTGAKGNASQKFSCSHDIILFYAKSKAAQFVPQYTSLDEKYVKAFYRYTDEDGRLYRKAGGGRPSHYRYYLDESKGTPVQSLWIDITNVQSGGEDTGYPTQKPLKLLERIINTSSKEGDIVLDPFCGCGTAVVAAQVMKRRWIGIDASIQAINATRSRCNRLPDNLGAGLIENDIIVRDLQAVKALKPLEFEAWVNEFYGATKPNPDRGVDGITPDGIPIQTKSYLVKYPVLTQAATDIKLHPVVPKPVSKAIIVSQTGFDDSARQAQFGIKQEYGVDFELITPESMLEADTAKRVRVI